MHFCIRPEERPEICHCQYEAHGLLLAKAQIMFTGLCWSWSKTLLQTPCPAGLNKMLWSRSCQGKMNCSSWRKTNSTLNWLLQSNRDSGVWVKQRILHPTKQDRTSRNLVSQPVSAAGLVGELGKVISSFCFSISPVCNMMVVMGWFPLPQKSKPIWDWLVDISIHCCSYTKAELLLFGAIELFLYAISNLFWHPQNKQTDHNRSNFQFLQKNVF